MSIDTMNDRLRLGLATPEEAEAFCGVWNANLNRFYEARYYGGRILLFDI